MADSIEEAVLTNIYTVLHTKYSETTFGTPELNNDGRFIWISPNIVKNTYYYDNNFERFIIYIYVSTFDYESTRDAALEVRNLFNKKVLTLATGYTNLHTYCAPQDIIYEQDFEAGIRTVRIITVNARAVKGT